MRRQWGDDSIDASMPLNRSFRRHGGGAAQGMVAALLHALRRVCAVALLVFLRSIDRSVLPLLHFAFMYGIRVKGWQHSFVLTAQWMPLVALELLQFTMRHRCCAVVALLIDQAEGIGNDHIDRSSQRHGGDRWVWIDPSIYWAIDGSIDRFELKAWRRRCVCSSAWLRCCDHASEVDQS
jgi:hypothetical protein